eukprot:TRINITY_DN73607_c0_g1_i1.p1 TRINITY_DN73607_c0_g1~~TRINITY_DN73607_c0_g1_i1.p1  ORF type:complete len:306 (-),score=76.45 TRINITY_DN73607_c0_g1_i1:418-1335(-)
MDAASIVAKAHGSALRALCDEAGMHYQGLRSAASSLRKQGRLSSSLAKKLGRLDDAFCINRHVSGPGMDTLLERISSELEKTRGCPGQVEAAAEAKYYDLCRNDEKEAEEDFFPDMPGNHGEVGARACSGTVFDGDATIAPVSDSSVMGDCELRDADFENKLKVPELLHRDCCGDDDVGRNSDFYSEALGVEAEDNKSKFNALDAARDVDRARLEAEDILSCAIRYEREMRGLARQVMTRHNELVEDMKEIQTMRKENKVLHGLVAQLRGAPAVNDNVEECQETDMQTKKQDKKMCRRSRKKTAA